MRAPSIRAASGEPGGKWEATDLRSWAALERGGSVMAGETAAAGRGRRLASAGGLELAVPECVTGSERVIEE